MSNKQNDKRTFTHEHFYLDAENYESFFVLIELRDAVPVASFIVKFPQPYLACTINPYVAN